MLEQNYRSTQTILNAANAVIRQNAGRKPKNLWSDAGDGELIVGYVADTEHDEAQFVAGEIRPAAPTRGRRATATRRSSTAPTPSPGPSRRSSSGSACPTRWSAGSASTSGARSATRSPTCGPSPTGPTTSRCAASSTCPSGGSATGPRLRWPSWAAKRADQLRRRAAPGGRDPRPGHPIGQPAHGVRRASGRARGDGRREAAGRRDPDQRAGAFRLPGRAARLEGSAGRDPAGEPASS